MIFFLCYSILTLIVIDEITIKSRHTIVQNKSTLAQKNRNNFCSVSNCIHYRSTLTINHLHLKKKIFLKKFTCFTCFASDGIGKFDSMS